MSVNLVVLSGRVGGDPIIRKFDTTKVANFSLATSEKGYKLQNGTEIPDQTEWHNISVRGNLVAVIEKFVKKGTLITVMGKIQYKDYEDKEGVKRKATNIFCESVDILSWESAAPSSVGDKGDDPF